jgi:uncharacterized protein
MTAGQIPESGEGSDSNFRLRLTEYIRAQALPHDKFGHQPRLYALTRIVGAGSTYDDDVVFAGAWLHDLGVFIGHRPEEPAALAAWNSVAYAVEHSPQVLRSVGFPEIKIAAVQEAIRTHQPHAAPTSIEGVILRDADILEQLGSIGILRLASKVGRDTRYSTFSDLIPVLRANLDLLPALAQLQTTKVMLRPRIEILRSFLEELERETPGGLY